MTTTPERAPLTLTSRYRPPAAPAFRYVSIVVCHRGVKAEKAPNILSRAGNERLYSTINASIFSKV